MTLQLRWVGEDELDRVARARMLCYAHAANAFERFREGIRADVRGGPGDFLLAEQEGTPVGTATSLPLTMWVRGSALPCQGVAYVGTIKTHRRRNVQGEGVATRIMRETLRAARDRGDVISALMPFRASFYEHFGYGVVERRSEWTVPLAVLPHGPFDGLRIFEPGDLPELVRLRQRVVERGQCDVERPARVWEVVLAHKMAGGFLMVDRPEIDGPIRGFLYLEHAQVGTKDYLRVQQINYEDADALRRQMHFLASLRDQYFAAVLTLPADLPLNWLLRESQLPHRPVNHDHAELRQDTRLQVRILDHKRFLESLPWPTRVGAKVTVEVRESEGTISRFCLDVSGGWADVSATDASADFVCPDRVWAAIACGNLSASRAVEWGLASSENRPTLEVLGALGGGPAPFCHEYF